MYEQDKWPVDEHGNPVLAQRPARAKYAPVTPWWKLKDWESILAVVIGIGGFPWYTVPGLIVLGLLSADSPVQLTYKELLARFVMWPYYLGVYAQAKINRSKRSKGNEDV